MSATTSKAIAAASDDPIEGRSPSVDGDLSAFLDQAGLEPAEQVAQVDSLSIEAQSIDAPARQLRDEVGIRDLHPADADEVELAGHEATKKLSQVGGETQRGIGAVE